MYKIKVAQKPALDEGWFSRLQELTGGLNAIFAMLMPETDYLAAEQVRFFAGDCQTNPNLRPKQHDDRILADIVAKLKSLQQEIAENEPNGYIRQAYDGHIQELVDNLEMVRAAAAGGHDRFMELNSKLYGMPDGDVFAAACSWIRKDIEGTHTEPGSELEALRNSALSVLPDVSGDANLLLPAPEIFNTVRNLHFAAGGYFDQLFAPDGMPVTPYIEQEFGDLVARQAIHNTGSDFAIIDATDGLWAVLSRRRQLIRPIGYRVDRDYFVGVIAHEIGSHILEEANGLRQPLRLLGLGLSGFEKGNEARAYLREQIIYPDESVFVRQPSWEYILALHVAVSVAAGLDRKQYTFVELYQFVYALHRFWRQRRFPMDTNNGAQVSEEAWQLAVRVMKGTDGTGGGYLKDTVYLQGSVACWNIARQYPEMILFGDAGKFNIADPEHLALLAGIGIKP